MRLPIPDVLTITVLREICGARDIYLSRIGERAGYLRLAWFMTVCAAVILNFKLRGYTPKLHTFFRGDSDRELHDHPWPFWSLVIMGGYYEEIPPDQWREGMNWKRETTAPFHPVSSAQGNQYIWRGVGELDFRPAKWRHRVILPEGERGPLPCVTLVFTKAKVREWGFHTGDGFVPWFRFIANKEAGEDC